MRRLVHQFISDLPEADVTLWARNEVHEGLARWTIGEGPGTRTSDLRRLIAGNRASEWVVIADDDVWLSRGDFATLITRARETDSVLIQPSHARTGSQHSHKVTVAKGDHGVRKVGFVEIGPIVAAHVTIARQLLPEDCGPAGWGLEWYWAGGLGLAHRMAIVDDVQMMHPNPIGRPSDEDLQYLERMRAQFSHVYFPPE
jgi:hypothetical protein